MRLCAFLSLINMPLFKKPARISILIAIFLISFLLLFKSSIVVPPAGSDGSTALPMGDFQILVDAPSCGLGGAWEHVTNPTFVSFNGGALLAMRTLTVLSKTRHKAAFDTWMSDIAFATMPAVEDLLSQQHVCTFLEKFSLGSQWRNESCQFSFWGGNTHAHGPEDPKCFLFKGELYILFGSRTRGRDPKGAWCEQPEHQDVLFAQFVMRVRPSKDQSSILSDEPVMISWLPPTSPKPARDIQKNFVPFVVNDRLFVSFSLEPHTVLALNEAFAVERVLTSSSSALQNLTSHRGQPTAARGNTPAILIEPVLLGLPRGPMVFLGVLHYQRPRGYYHHHLYIFQASPPFTILAVSCELPIHTSARFHLPAMMPAVAYVSGLALQGDTAIITYGSGDKDARVLVQRLAVLWAGCRAHGSM